MRKAYAVLAILVVIAGLVSTTAYNLFSKRGDVVRIAIELNDHSAAFWIALDKGWFKEKGINVEYIPFSTGLELATAMARGDIDIAIACIGPLIMIRSRGFPVKLVSMMHLHGYAIVARRDIASIEDLSGKTVSVSGPGSPTWLLLHLVIDKYGLRNVKVKTLPPYMALNALLTGRVDAAVLPEHYATLSTRKGVHVILRSQDVWPSMPGSGLVVRGDYLSNHRDTVLEILGILEHAIMYIRENPVDSARIVARYLGVDYSIISESMEYLDYTCRVNVSSIELYIEYLVRYGAIDKPVSIDDFIDYSIVGGLEN